MEPPAPPAMPNPDLEDGELEDGELDDDEPVSPAEEAAAPDVTAAPTTTPTVMAATPEPGAQAQTGETRFVLRHWNLLVASPFPHSSQYFLHCLGYERNSGFGIRWTH